MEEKFISRFRQEAKKNLTHYFWLIGKRARITVKEELLHEIERAGGAR